MTGIRSKTTAPYLDSTQIRPSCSIGVDGGVSPIASVPGGFGAALTCPPQKTVPGPGLNFKPLFTHAFAASDKDASV
jgi:hypothetical protein